MTETTLRDYTFDVIAQFTGQQNVLVIPRPFITILGSLDAALVLSQIIYWSDRAKMKNGWFAKSYAEWQEELALSKYQVSKAIGNLKSAGVETKVKKFDGSPTVHYHIDKQVFSQWIVKKLDELGKSKNLTNESAVSLLSSTEITTEPTTETTTEIKPPIPPKGGKKVKSSKIEELDPRFEALIKAWLDGSQTVEANPYSTPSRRKEAKQLHEKGITPTDITAYIKSLRAQEFWVGKPIGWKQIRSGIMPWKEAGKAAANNPAFRRVEAPPEPDPEAIPMPEWVREQFEKDLQFMRDKVNGYGE